ncbi:S66 peptidase family protein [Salininema proteolyticum]|uniref:LD-carboxypeptidase n=1 Tax=Salininema proteolyticum TaxID=1607685 RepID=A0ABV8U5W5_9ACTN
MIRELARPPRLKRGDKVAVVAPSGPVARESHAERMAVLSGWGLEPVVMPHVFDEHPDLWFLAGNDRDRAADFQAAWCDREVAAVFSDRGGYGAGRIIDLLDWEAMAKAGPKLYVGYSDATALHEAIAARLGLATLHGPMPGVSAFADDRTREHLRRTLFEPESVRTIRAESSKALVSGRAEGVTLGGCASLLGSTVGGPHSLASAAGGLVCLEDVEEEDYRLDRILTQLRRSGWFDGVAGVLLGSWKDCGPYERVRAVLADRLGDLGVPVVEEFGFGHGLPALTIPFGVRASLDADAGVLELEEPALL